MPTLNVSGNPVVFSYGWIIAMIVLVLCVVLAVVSPALSPMLILGLVGALALSRLC